MLAGRFAQFMEFLSLLLIVFGIFALCQWFSLALYSHGLAILFLGWVGYSIWSHRKPVRPYFAEGNPQKTINGRPPLEVTIAGGVGSDQSETCVSDTPG